MSGCSYEYKFYLNSEDAHKTLADKLNEDAESDELTQTLGLEHCFESDRNSVESYALRDNYFELHLYTSTTTDVNYALIRAFKDHGSEFCYVDVYNDQVGEGDSVYLYRGKCVSGDALEKLLKQYNVGAEPDELLERGAHGLDQALSKGLNPNSMIDGEPLLVAAYDRENKEAFDLLLKHGADANTRTEETFLLFHIAAYEDRDKYGFMPALINAGADYRREGPDGESLLWHLGAKHTKLAKRIKKDGVAFARPKDAYEHKDELIDKLEVACAHHDQEYIDKFHNELIEDEEPIPYMLKLYAAYNVPDKFDSLMQKGVEIEADSVEEMVGLAAASGAKPIFQYLMAYAKEHSLEFEEASDITEMLAPNSDCLDLLQQFVGEHPDSVSHYTIYKAVEHRADDNLRFLLKHYQDDEQPGQLLSEVADELHSSSVDILLEHGEDPLFKEYDEESVLVEILKNDEVNQDAKAKLLKWLITQPANIALEQHIYLRNDKAAATCLKNIDKSKLAEGDLNRYLSLALRHELPDAANTLKKMGATFDTPADEMSPLLVAIEEVNAESCLFLLDNGADPNSFYTSASDEDDNEATNAVMKAFGIDEEYLDDPVDKLIHLEPIKPNQEVSALMFAAWVGDTRILQILMAAQANIEHTDKRKITALMCAAEAGHSECVKLLVDRGAEVNAFDDFGNTALHYAVLGGAKECCEILVNAGATVEQKNTSKHNTPLNLGCLAEQTDTDTLEYLLSQGADINAADDEGQTPLMLACMTADSQRISFLLNNSADVNYVCAEGYTADEYYLVTGADDAEIIQALQPTNPNIKNKKRMAIAKRVGIQFGFVALVAAPIAYFSITFGVIIFLMGAGFFVWREARGRKEVAQIIETGPQISDNPILQNFTNVLGKVEKQVREEEAKNQDILDSWDEDDRKAG